MPQNPIGVVSATPTQSALDITAAAVIKASPGRISKITVQTVPSAGNLIINDCTTTGAAAAANQILEIAFGSLTEGQVIDLGNWPCLEGITISSVGTGGVYAMSYT